MIVGADAEPMLQVVIEDKQTPMLVDTGDAYTCVSQKHATHLPMSNKFVETMGYSGIKQLTQVAAPVHLAKEGIEIIKPVLVSHQTLINLLARDVPCKLKIKIWCTPKV